MFERVIGTLGDGDGQFDSPAGVVALGGGRGLLALCDRGNHRLVIRAPSPASTLDSRNGYSYSLVLWVWG